MTGNPWDAQAYDAQFGFVSRYGDDLLDLLDPRPRERVLDLGCGTGRHAAAIAARGALVVGMDLDEQMLAKARTDHPGLDFRAADATSFGLADLGQEQPFDACFSNAALHWMTPHDRVLRNVRGVLADGARFVAELGGAGNVAALDESLRAALEQLGYGSVDLPDNHFPSVAGEASALEAAGFRVELAMWFARPTPLTPGTSARDWTRHFRARAWEAVPEALHERLGAAIDELAQARGLRTDEGWIADYRRLRFVAVAS